jgi:hypothetical protein
LIEPIEAKGIIVSSRLKIETELKKKNAFDEKSAVNADKSMLNFSAILKIMEENGLIGKTADGKIFLTQKCRNQQLHGFSINEIPPHTIVRFSRNK